MGFIWELYGGYMGVMWTLLGLHGGYGHCWAYLGVIWGYITPIMESLNEKEHGT